MNFGLVERLLVQIILSWTSKCCCLWWSWYANCCNWCLKMVYISMMMVAGVMVIPDELERRSDAIMPGWRCGSRLCFQCWLPGPEFWNFGGQQMKRPDVEMVRAMPSLGIFPATDVVKLYNQWMRVFMSQCMRPRVPADVCGTNTCLPDMWGLLECEDSFPKILLVTWGT